MCETHSTKKIHAIAPAQHLPATSHSRIISNTLIHTPQETRQATSQHNTSHPNPRSNTTSNTPHNTVRDSSQPQPQSSTTSNTPRNPSPIGRRHHRRHLLRHLPPASAIERPQPHFSPTPSATSPTTPSATQPATPPHATPSATPFPFSRGQVFKQNRLSFWFSSYTTQVAEQQTQSHYKIILISNHNLKHHPDQRYSHGQVISRNPPVPADRQIAHHRGHSEESAYYPSFWKYVYYPSSKLQPKILQCSYLPYNPQNWNLLIRGPFFGAMALIILILGNSWGLGV